MISVLSPLRQLRQLRQFELFRLNFNKLGRINPVAALCGTLRHFETTGETDNAEG